MATELDVKSFIKDDQIYSFLRITGDDGKGGKITISHTLPASELLQKIDTAMNKIALPTEDNTKADNATLQS